MSAQPLQATINVPDLLSALEPFIRRVVREELAAVKSTPNTFHLEPGSALYEDMEEILQRKTQGKIELFSHKEVWGGTQRTGVLTQLAKSGDNRSDGGFGGVTVALGYFS